MYARFLQKMTILLFNGLKKWKKEVFASIYFQMSVKNTYKTRYTEDQALMRGLSPVCQILIFNLTLATVQFFNIYHKRRIFLGLRSTSLSTPHLLLVL